MAKNKAGIDDKTLNELKESLLTKKKKIQKQLLGFAKKGKIKGDYETEFPHIGDWEDENAVEVTMYENNLGVEHELEKDLLAIDKALDRIKDGTYGICLNCGEPQKIELKRLKAYPEANSCLICEKKE